jgi:uncharacterized membrane protein YjfL (UPF0719 family)
MLGIVNLAGNALKAFGSVHPAIKWGVVVLVGLLAVEFVGREGIALYRDMATTPAQIEQQNAAATKAAYDAQVAKELGQRVLPDPSRVSPRMVGIAPAASDKK